MPKKDKTNDYIVLRIFVKKDDQWVAQDISSIQHKSVIDYCYEKRNEEIVLMLGAHDDRIFFVGSKGPMLPLMESTLKGVLPMKALKLLNTKMDTSLLMKARGKTAETFDEFNIAIDDEKDGYNNIQWASFA